MKRTYRPGKLFGLELQITPSAIWSTLALWAILTLVGWAGLKMAPGTAVLGGLLATFIHWDNELMHQLGHAWAARRTGYPMTGLRTWYLLSASLYPRDEGSLPAEIHIRRALGGPPVSIALAILGGILVWLLPSGTLLYWLALFFALENLFVFGLGAFVPLGFTDGSTLLTWWPRRGQTN
ncbi:MAG: hypothetical protein D6706_21065 [Chloroflexi bacterium]|nr:MAG: hypothetical protein D6706_21065 [Chloroflexota bacterium]